jgi:hypothetical protein
VPAEESVLGCGSADGEFSEAFPSEFEASEDVDSPWFSSAWFVSDDAEASDDPSFEA